jgi:hypothetical protein
LRARGRRPDESTVSHLPLEFSRIDVAHVAKAELVIGVNDVQPTIGVNVKGDDAGAWMMKPECFTYAHGSATKVENAIVHYMITRDS